MTLDEQFAATIQTVRAAFGFSHFSCDPDEITAVMRIFPDEVRRIGEVRSLRSGSKFETPFSSWSIESHTDSKDVNDHLRDLLTRLKGTVHRLKPEWGVPTFGVTYRAAHLRGGNGPFYEVDVLRGMATFRAELWQDIYAIDDDELDRDSTTS